MIRIRMLLDSAELDPTDASTGGGERLGVGDDRCPGGVDSGVWVVGGVFPVLNGRGVGVGGGGPAVLGGGVAEVGTGGGCCNQPQCNH